MILDERGEFADAFTLVGNAATTYIMGDTIDLGATPTLRDMGTGEDLFVVCQIDDTVLAGAGAANVTFRLVSDSTANLTTSPTVHFQTAAIAKATLVAGYQVFAFRLPSGVTYERYLGVTFTPDTNNVTAGKANAFLTKNINAFTAYPNAID